LGDHHDPGPGRLAAEDGAADRDRLACDDLRHGVAGLHRVRVHHPGHRLLVGGHVRRGDVGLRPDLADELRGEAAGELLELARRSGTLTMTARSGKLSRSATMSETPA